MLDVLHLGWSFWRVITRAVRLHCDGYVMQQEIWVLGLKIKDKTEPSFAMLQIHKFSLFIIQCSSFFSIPLLCWCEWRSIWTWDLCLFLVMNTTTLSLHELVHGCAGHSPWCRRRFCFSPNQGEPVQLLLACLVPSSWSRFCTKQKEILWSIYFNFQGNRS